MKQTGQIQQERQVTEINSACPVAPFVKQFFQSDCPPAALGSSPEMMWFRVSLSVWKWQRDNLRTEKPSCSFQTKIKSLKSISRSSSQSKQVSGVPFSTFTTKFNGYLRPVSSEDTGRLGESLFMLKLSDFTFASMTAYVFLKLT